MTEPSTGRGGNGGDQGRRQGMIVAAGGGRWPRSGTTKAAAAGVRESFLFFMKLNSGVGEEWRQG
jgi:hypothetical protein